MLLLELLLLHANVGVVVFVACYCWSRKSRKSHRESAAWAPGMAIHEGGEASETTHGLVGSAQSQWSPPGLSFWGGKGVG